MRLRSVRWAALESPRSRRARIPSTLSPEELRNAASRLRAAPGYRAINETLMRGVHKVNSSDNPEAGRIAEADAGEAPWRRWGPYLSERQWGTVREDYSEGGDAWSYFSHDAALYRAYRWGEDGLA